MQDTQTMKGHFKIFNNATNELLVEKDNLIVAAAKNMLRNIFSGQSSIYVQSFAFGTGVAPPLPGNTGLGVPIEYDTGKYYKAFEEYTNDTTTSITFVGYWSSLQPVTQPVEITEVGLFTGIDGTAGTMFCRATFDAITKSTAVELRLEYTIAFT